MALSMKQSVSLPTRRCAAPSKSVRSVVSRRQVSVRAESGKAFDSNWLKADPLVFMLGFAGWTVPSTIGTSAFGGNSLFGLFTASIGENLANFPVGPGATDKFWLYFALYHVGLFTTLLLGQVGVQGRKQGYW